MEKVFIDTHAHLLDKKLPNIEEVVNNYQSVGVKKVINMACCVKTARECAMLSEKYDSVYFGAGIHPQDIKEATDADLDEIKKIAMHDKCVCIGEIGLDYYWDKSYIDIQKEMLVKELEIANELKLPFSFHSREATLDTLTLLKQNKDKIKHGGVIHCFSGSKETARELLNLGLKIGIGGTATFKNARHTSEVLEFVPAEEILTETDCPYLSPEPFRGKVNEPKNIPIILDFIANKKGIDSIELSQIIYKTAIELFTKLKEKNKAKNNS